MKTYMIVTVGKVSPEQHAWFARMQTGVKKFAQETNHHTSLVGPSKADEALQQQVIEDLITQGVDALCVVPLLPQALEIILMKAQRQGIVVISHEADNLRNTDYDIEAFDNAAYGAHLMDLLATHMHKEGGYVVFLGSLTGTSHSEWAKAAIDRQQKQYTHMSQKTRKIEDHDNYRLAHDKAKEILATYPKLGGLLGLGMTASIGIGRAIEEMGRQQQVAAVGTGLVSKCQPYLKSGAINALCFWDPADTGYVMNKLAVMVLEGQSVINGMDLGIPGYTNMTIHENVLYGSAWIDVTEKNMMEYNF